MFELPALHPIFVHFPIALLPVAFVCELLGRLTGRTSLSNAAWWALLFATLAAPLTAASGWYWMNEMGDMDHVEMKIHQWLGTGLPVLLIPLAVWRYRIHMRNLVPSWAFVAVLSVAVGAVTVQGHLGGLMTFGNSAPSTDTPRAESGHSHQHGEMPMSNPTTHAELTPSTTAPTEDGWSDSIHVKDHHHE